MKTVTQLKSAKVRVNMVHLAAEVHIFKQICKQTMGDFSVAMNGGHFNDILFESIPPPPSIVDEKLREQRTYVMVVMGFPTRIQDSVPTYCVW